MKKLLLSSSLIIAFAISLSAQVNFTQNFDTCTAGDYAAECIGAPWTTWSGTVGTAEDAVVSATQSSSAPNAAYIGSTSTDFVVLLGDLTTGVYDISFDFFVENGKMGYFNIMNSFTGGTYLWATDVYVRSTGYLSWTADNVSDSIPFAFDTWTKIGYTIDLNNDTAFMYVDDSLVNSWKFSKGTLGTGTTLKLAAMDFYGAAEDLQPGYYIDDFSFAINTTGIVENENNVSLYPNPATNAITIEGQANNRFEIFNTGGQMLLSGILNNNSETIDISTLNAGCYFIRCIGNDVTVNQFIVE
ncbi:MAG TPA: T9SS type A sorting domain-containing protein [Bacteroidales bacterium]|nr:T9SS type A sorting domain-containing protein [Bacteroidales bacterium]